LLLIILSTTDFFPAPAITGLLCANREMPLARVMYSVIPWIRSIYGSSEGQECPDAQRNRIFAVFARGFDGPLVIVPKTSYSSGPVRSATKNRRPSLARARYYAIEASKGET
jgi:hypothetical protein